MGLLDDLTGLAKAAARAAGDGLRKVGEDDDAEDSPKARAGAKTESGEDGESDGNETAPGGGNEDDAGNSPAPIDKSNKDPKALFWDPFAIVEQLGYRDRPSNISYGTLKAMAYRMPIVHALVQTRVQQVAAFSRAQHNRYELGYRIRLRDPMDKPSKQDQKFIEQMESMVQRTGITDNPRGRDNFEKFLRKLTWDSLIYDQMCFEVVPNKKGEPAEWYAVDASSIRLADSARQFIDEDLNKQVRFVQIYDGMIVTEYNQEELCFGVRNPRTDMKLYGYGTSELEMLISTITSLLYAWEYNTKFFAQGSAAKGLLNFKGAISEKALRGFRRHWYMMLSGVQNAWKTPITNAEEVQWVSMQTSNRDMEFNAWMDFLIKVACSMYQMDPIEVNFKYGNTGQKGGMNEANNKEKIIESKERGLRPLLRFLATAINQHLVWPVNEHFEFEFVGLDAKTQDDVAELNMKRVKTYRTIDELRAEDDLPPLPEGMGEVILDPTWASLKNSADNQAMGLPPGGAPNNPFGGDDKDGKGGDEDGDPDFAKLLGDPQDAPDDDDDEGDDDDEPAKPAKGADGGKKPNPFAKKSMIVDVKL